MLRLGSHSRATSLTLRVAACERETASRKREKLPMSLEKIHDEGVRQHRAQPGGLARSAGPEEEKAALGQGKESRNRLNSRWSRHNDRQNDDRGVISSRD